jgi:hypothetical protein
MNIYNLPRGYLSYSAYHKWKTSKDQFRRLYYENEKPIETVETRFGKKTDSFIDDGGIIEGVVNYSHNQYKIEAEYNGLKILGYLDGFNEPNLAILERKTGHKSKTGKVPWDTVKVRRHDQLPFYCLLVKLKHGAYNPDVILQWLETDFKDETREFDGHILTGKVKKLHLTGEIATFNRHIEQWELDRLLVDLLNVAKEITEDYENYKKNKR